MKEINVKQASVVQGGNLLRALFFLGALLPNTAGKDINEEVIILY